MIFLQQNFQSKEYNGVCLEYKFDSIMPPPPQKKKKNKKKNNNTNESLNWKAVQKESEE